MTKTLKVIEVEFFLSKTANAASYSNVYSERLIASFYGESVFVQHLHVFLESIVAGASNFN